MAMLSPRTRLDDGISRTTHERNARHIVELVHAWGLAHDQEGHAPPEADVRLRFDGSDRAAVRTVADIWRR
jgi:hypothetical protein